MKLVPLKNPTFKANLVYKAMSRPVRAIYGEPVFEKKQNPGYLFWPLIWPTMLGQHSPKGPF